MDPLHARASARRAQLAGSALACCIGRDGVARGVGSCHCSGTDADWHVGLLLIACAALFAANRLQQALLRNERYRFTTWRWGKVVLGLVLIGWIMKLVATA